MFDGHPSATSNLFKLAEHPARPPRRKQLVSALKLLLLIVVAFSITIAIASQSRRWLVQRLTHDFATLSSTDKQHRLAQLAKLGLPALEALVDALADADVNVARGAYELLRSQQNEWATLERHQRIGHHRALVAAMHRINASLADDRTLWTTSLLRQSIAIAIDRRDEAESQLYAAATAMLGEMSLSSRSGASVLVDDERDDREPRRLSVQGQPLPVMPAGELDHWTQWPPATEASPRLSPTSDENDSLPAPTIYRSAASMVQPLQDSKPVVLQDVNATLIRSEAAPVQEAAFTTKLETAEVRPASHLVDSPLETYDTKSVIYWLGSSQESLREVAVKELDRRGLSSQEIGLATQIAAGDVQTRLQLVDAITRDDSIDPRPWLLLLLRDPSRDVKLRTISVLATIKDPAVERELRSHIIDEPDPTVAFRIRRLLNLR